MNGKWGKAECFSKKKPEMFYFYKARNNEQYGFQNKISTLFFLKSDTIYCHYEKEVILFNFWQAEKYKNI